MCGVSAEVLHGPHHRLQVCGFHLMRRITGGTGVWWYGGLRAHVCACVCVHEHMQDVLHTHVCVCVCETVCVSGRTLSILHASMPCVAFTCCCVSSCASRSFNTTSLEAKSKYACAGEGGGQRITHLDHIMKTARAAARRAETHTPQGVRMRKGDTEPISGWVPFRSARPAADAGRPQPHPRPPAGRTPPGPPASRTVGRHDTAGTRKWRAGRGICP